MKYFSSYGSRLMLLVKLFGDLRKKAKNPTSSSGGPNTFTIKSSGITDVRDLLRKLQIPEAEVSHIFVNGRYSSVKKKLADGDTIAFFPRNMGLLYKWYFKKEE